jgi:ABC-type lipoprotein release transport system permease subunit
MHELVVGTELARRLKLDVGSRLPPFYHSLEGEHVSEVVGVFRADVTLWQANLVLTTLDAASHIFDQREVASELLLRCRPGYAEQVRQRILRSDVAPGDAGHAGAVRLEVATRDDLRALLPRGWHHRDGVFTLHFALLFVAAILVVLVTSGFGLGERRREIGILKATGWQTDEILLRGLAESLSLGLGAALVAVVLAFGWLRWFNGFWIASVFLAGVGPWPSFAVPFRLAPLPAILAVIVSLVIVMSGTLYSSWRAAVASPSLAMR